MPERMLENMIKNIEIYNGKGYQKIYQIKMPENISERMPTEMLKHILDKNVKKYINGKKYQ